MNQAYLAIAIIAITVVLFFVDKYHPAIVALFCMVAMSVTGVITWTEAFSGFSSQAFLMNVSIMMMTGALFKTGLADDIGNFLMRFTKKGEKFFVIMLWLLSSLLSIVINCLVVFVIMMPIIDMVSAKSKGLIRRKMTYSVIAIGTVYGAMASAWSSTSLVTAASILEASGYGRRMLPFEPVWLGGSLILLGLIFYATFGYKLMEKVYDFPDPPAASLSAVSPQNQNDTPALARKAKAKKILAGLIFAGVTIGYIIGFNLAGTTFVGVFLLLATGCMDIDTAFKSVSWIASLMIAFCIGFAYALDVSGAGLMIANAIIKVSGPLGQSQFGLFLVMMFIATLLSNFMSNNAAVSLTTPIAIAMAATVGADAMGFTMATGFGANLAISTPLSVSIVTMSMAAGYRAKHLLCVNGVMNVLGFITCGIVGYFIYYM